MFYSISPTGIIDSTSRLGRPEIASQEERIQLKAVKSQVNSVKWLFVILYLSNLLVVRHQMTACLSETSMSSNRSGTAEGQIN